MASPKQPISNKSFGMPPNCAQRHAKHRGQQPERNNLPF